jgi:hypothetical protein
MTFAHVGGIPLEETLGLYGPALVLMAGAASASLGARLRRIGRRPRTPSRRIHDV